VTIATIDKSEIQSFDVFDEYGTLIASFNDETSFVSFIFSLTGCYEVAFYTSDYIFRGWITLSPD